MTTLQELGRCLNCGLKLFFGSKWKLAVSEISYTHQTILAQWIKQQLPEGGKICAACLNAIEKCENDEQPPRTLGHSTICTGCGLSQLRKRHKTYTSEEDLTWMFPWYKQLETRFICKSCERQLNRKKTKITCENAVAENSIFIPSDFKNDINSEASMDKIETPTDLKSQTISNTKLTIFGDGNLIIPGYKRASITRGICIIPKCKAPGKLIPRVKRKMIFLQTDTLLSRRASLCKTHLHANEWGSLVHVNGYSDFTIQHVEDIINMCEKPPSIIDFDRINEMPNHICNYWTGLGVEEFKDLYEKLDVDTSQFQSLRNALAIYLLRKKTGDSLVRLADLFWMTTSLLSRQLLVIEKSYEKKKSLDK